MVSKVLTLFFTSLLSLSTATGTTTAQAVESPQVYEESVDYSETPEYTEEDVDEEDANEEDSMTVEEKYAHNQNKEDYLEDDGETLIWYDVPYCDDHDYEVIEGDTETMYICKKCGYSYSEFPEESEDEPEEELPEESDSDSEK